jgi:catechol 2,3-dioxygenase-like lactoylglutathione lyase family enzyme
MLYGRPFQICYLVDDLEAAINHFVRTLGAGPFFCLPPRRFQWLAYAGKPAMDHAINGGLALGYTGDLQIELIVPGPAASPYRDFIAAGGSGVHHIGFESHDFEHQRAAGLAAGMRVVLEGASSLARFAYLESDPARPGTIVELIEMSEAVATVFAQIRAASIGWDGRDPVRRLEG